MRKVIDETRYQISPKRMLAPMQTNATFDEKSATEEVSMVAVVDNAGRMIFGTMTFIAPMPKPRHNTLRIILGTHISAGTSLMADSVSRGTERNAACKILMKLAKVRADPNTAAIKAIKTMSEW